MGTPCAGPVDKGGLFGGVRRVEGTGGSPRARQEQGQEDH